MRNANGFGRPVQLGIILLQETFQRIGCVALIQSIQQNFRAIYQYTAPIRKPNDTGAAAANSIAQCIGVGTAGNYRDPGLPQFLNGTDAIPIYGSLFKQHFLCSLLHFILKLLLQFAAFAFQHLNTLSDDILIGLRGQHTGADTAAFFHMQLQARPFLSDIPGEFPGTAGQQKRLRQQPNGHVGSSSATVRSKIQCIILFSPSGYRKLGVWFFADTNKGITLIIFQQNIVFRFILFDQRVFQQKCIQLRIGKNRLKIVDIGDHAPGFQRMCCQIGKILTDPVSERFGFADINDYAFFVVHQVHARKLGQAVRLLFQLFKCHSATSCLIVKMRPVKGAFMFRTIL